MSFSISNTQPQPNCLDSLSSCIALAKKSIHEDCELPIVAEIERKIEDCEEAYSRNQRWFGTGIANVMLDFCIDRAYGSSNEQWDDCEEQHKTLVDHCYDQFVLCTGPSN